MKKIKSSFIGKAFFSLILLYFVVFLFLFVFQGIVFRTYYTRRTIQDIKDEITILSQKEDYDDIIIEQLLFSRNTQTVSLLKPLNEVQNNISNLDLIKLSVVIDSETINIFAPKSEEIKYEIGQSINATAYLHESSNYIPTYLSVDNKTIIRSNNSTDNTVDDELITDFLGNTPIQVTGEISGISGNDSSEINSIISSEILNIASKNYLTIVDYDLGNYYYTNNSTTQESSLVFYSIIDIENEDYLLISIYSMDHVEEIVLAANRANVYMFIVVLAILMIASFVYSREFSKPLLFINKKTKDLSKLNFSAPLIEIESSDEFAELATNINTLSVNLQTTLYQLSEQNKQLSDAIAKENKVEASRRDFVQGMSHELKTPLAVIQASAEALENNIYEKAEDKENALQLIQKEVTKTNNMIKSMMTVYKIDSPTYQEQWKEENLKELVLAIDKSLSPLYYNSNIEVKLNLMNATLKCDKDRIETIITNLYTNAIKYTPNNNKILITLNENHNSIYFEIKNYGATIPKEEQLKIFEPFYRVDKARSRQDGSTGLGLYIVNQTLEQYNSECQVTSDKESTTFSFKIEKSY